MQLDVPNANRSLFRAVSHLEMNPGIGNVSIVAIAINHWPDEDSQLVITTIPHQRLVAQTTTIQQQRQQASTKQINHIMPTVLNVMVNCLQKNALPAHRPSPDLAERDL